MRIYDIPVYPGLMRFKTEPRSGSGDEYAVWRVKNDQSNTGTGFDVMIHRLDRVNTQPAGVSSTWYRVKMSERYHEGARHEAMPVNPFQLNGSERPRNLLRRDDAVLELRSGVVSGLSGPPPLELVPVASK